MSPLSAMDEDEASNAGLSLGLGMGGHVVKKDQKQKQSKPVANCLDFVAFELCPKREAIKVADAEFSLDQKNGCRKKLRLSKEQSALLEDSFNQHTTLNPAQKQALAEQLNLKPRQVEVWFQNRRARTKMKQTELDCEFLKKYCENLTDENRRLKKEVQELRALKVGPSPLYIQLSKAATLTLCSSCHKKIKPTEARTTNHNAAISDMTPKKRSHKLRSGLDLEGSI